MIPTSHPVRPAPRSWRAAVLGASILGAAGWLLSAVGFLGSPGYLLVLLAVAAALLRIGAHRPLGQRVRRHRWRRPLPALFLVLVVLSFLGGLLHEPNNIDALAYRTPRVLHWLAEGRWHWIECPYNRLNTRATGFEWLSAPVLALLGSDRPLFLINIGCFLLLPGLTFSTLRQAGVGGRVAWHWMWLFPGGYCFVLQAGSIANDLYGATAALAAFAFGLRARRSRGASDLLYSGLALALATGAKLSNLPLALPWLWTVAPALPALTRRPAVTVGALLLAALASILPISVLNQIHGGDWTGSRAEYAWTTPPDPASAVVHNVGLLAVQNLLPPILPVAGALNRTIEQALPEAWKARLDGFAENGRRAYSVRELPGEEHAGLGFGVTWLLLAGLLGRLAAGRRRAPSAWTRLDRTRRWLLGVPAAALMPYLAKSGITTAGRILAPYYGWLLPLLLMPGRHEVLTRSRLWRRLAAGSLLLAALVLILIPSRPLWPARTVLRHLAAGRPDTGAIGRAATVYDVYGNRSRALAPIARRIPPEESTVGFLTANDAETSLWKPYGTRRVHHLTHAADRADLDARGIRWLVASVDALEAGGTPLDTWARERGLTVVSREPLRLLASAPPTDFVLLQAEAGAR